MAFYEGRSAQFTHTEWIEGINQEFAAVSMPSSIGHLGFAVQLFDSGDIELRGDAPSENPLGAYSIKNVALSLAYARSLTDRIAAGITYTQSNGRFTVSEDGTYRIWGMLIVEDRSGGTPTLVTLQVKVDGAAVYTIPGMAVHSVADPVLVPFGILRTLTANRYVEVTLTEDAANDIRTTPGCTLNVVRIA